MKLTSGLSLAYCTNVHRGEGWVETFAGLRDHALRVRDRVSPGKTYVLGLRLGDLAAKELAVPATLAAFRGACLVRPATLQFLEPLAVRSLPSACGNIFPSTKVCRCCDSRARVY